MTEWNAHNYNRQSTLQQVMAEEQLALLTLNGDDRILDVGCGDGKITAEVANRVPRGSVLGTDPSKDMIAFAASHFTGPKYANLRFEVADVRRMPYRNEFDLIISFNALHWVPEQSEALDCLRAAIKPQGRVLLRFVSQGSRTSLEDVIEQTRKLPQWANYFPGYRKPYLHLTPAEYQTLANQHGFQVVRLHVNDKAWDFKTRESFVNFAHATFVEWTRLVPESDRLAFITDVLNTYQTIAATTPEEMNTFKFYQMEIELKPARIK
ncbi:MAG TPA: methyltransferase domain-containing protein [Gemmatales bacterium]|nr:methyltransferase domain-containing protein [Gemmatales bacterium]